MDKKATFLVFTEYGELLDLAIALQDEGNEVLMHIPNKEYEKIGDGIVKKEKNWHSCLGKDYVWVFDGCNSGNLQDWLRARGEVVFGGNEKADKLENDRQMGQALFKAAGFYQPFSQNFKDIEEALNFVRENADKRWILKQNGDAPKSLNHMGKFPGSEDMLYHLEGLKKNWNEGLYGKFDCDLMEIVEGVEMAASAWFNGTDWMRDEAGKVVGFINFEEKKEIDGNLGETTGEMGTTFLGVDEDNKLFQEMMLKPKITDTLRKLNYRGVFDINCIKTKQGMVALEPTCRFGIPATSYEFIEGLDMPAGELIEAVAKGLNIPVKIKKGFGMVMVIAGKPYPVEADIVAEATSMNERIWILKDKKPVDEFSPEQKTHIHLQNFYKEDGIYKVATKNGYLMTVTGMGKTISETRDNLIDYIKSNIYISGMKYRSDIGVRIEESAGVAKTLATKLKFLEEEYRRKDAERERQVTETMSSIKQGLKKKVYG